jgi:hypothetical protein
MKIEGDISKNSALETIANFIFKTPSRRRPLGLHTVVFDARLSPPTERIASRG